MKCPKCDEDMTCTSSEAMFGKYYICEKCDEVRLR